jgi:hypothetical protein
MKRFTIYNKLFIVFCVAMIALIAWKAPHEKENKSSKKQNIEGVQDDNR